MERIWDSPAFCGTKSILFKYSNARKSKFFRLTDKAWRVAATMESREADMTEVTLYGSGKDRVI